MQENKKGRLIQSVQRAIDIINCFDESNVELSLTQISEQVNLNRSTAHGIISTLVANGYLRQKRAGLILLGHVLLQKSMFAQGASRISLIDVAKPCMFEVAARCQMAVNLFIIENWHPHHLLKTLPQDAVYMIQHVSDQDPLYCTATGKLLMAHMPAYMLDEYITATNLTAQSVSGTACICEKKMKQELLRIIANGSSNENEELGEGVSAISVPIYHPDQVLLGAISVTGVANAVSRCRSDITQSLMKASATIMSHLS